MRKFYIRKFWAVALVFVLLCVFIAGCSPAIPPITGESLTPPELSIPDMDLSGEETPPSGADDLVPPDNLSPPESFTPPSDDSGNNDNTPDVNDDQTSSQPSQPPSAGNSPEQLPEEPMPEVPPVTENPPEPPSEEEPSEPEPFVGLSVHYLDVGQGDAILICLPDGKSMLIDCGNSSASSVETIIRALKAKEITQLDYLIITHPDSDHIGGIKSVLKEIGVRKVYHPDVPEDRTCFNDYYSTLEFLKEKCKETEISLSGECFGEDYKVAILAPKHRVSKDSSYRALYMTDQPTETQINDVSPYIYLQYKNYRFLFTGDNSSKQEEKLLSDYNSSILKNMFSNIEGFSLENIDFLKVAHHGSNDSSCEELLNLVKPKYAVVSVGDNSYGHPATSALERLVLANPNVNIMRTDVKGTVSVFIDNQGAFGITPSE